MVTFQPATVRAMVHLFGQTEDGGATEAEGYYMVGVDLVVPSVYPEQEGIAAGRDEVRIVAKNWMTSNEMAVLIKIALLEIGNVGIISRIELVLWSSWIESVKNALLVQIQYGHFKRLILLDITKSTFQARPNTMTAFTARSLHCLWPPSNTSLLSMSISRPRTYRRQGFRS